MSYVMCTFLARDTRFKKCQACQRLQVEVGFGQRVRGGDPPAGPRRELQTRQAAGRVQRELEAEIERALAVAHARVRVRLLAVPSPNHRLDRNKRIHPTLQRKPMSVYLLVSHLAWESVYTRVYRVIRYVYVFEKSVTSLE